MGAHSRSRFEMCLRKNLFMAEKVPEILRPPFVASGLCDAGPHGCRPTDARDSRAFTPPPAEWPPVPSPPERNGGARADAHAVRRRHSLARCWQVPHSRGAAHQFLILQRDRLGKGTSGGWRAGAKTQTAHWSQPPPTPPPRSRSSGSGALTAREWNGLCARRLVEERTGPAAPLSCIAVKRKELGVLFAARQFLSPGMCEDLGHASSRGEGPGQTPALQGGKCGCCLPWKLLPAQPADWREIGTPPWVWPLLTPASGPPPGRGC